MNAKHRITINGQAYDAITGLPLTNSSTKSSTEKRTVSASRKDIARAPVQKAKEVHQRTQKSVTLQRRYVQAPKSAKPVAAAKRAPLKVERSPKIYRFAPHPEPLKQSKAGETKIVSDMVAKPAPFTKAAPAKRKPMPAEIMKKQLIARASKQLDEKPVAKTKRKSVREIASKPISRRRLVAASVALVMLSGYFMYLNMPSISMYLASNEAGINASYPSYRPDGYSFTSPVAYQPGEIELKFKSNTDESKSYTIRQKVSGWNSTAVLDNLVMQQSGGAYETSSQGGVIVYTYGSRAAWSNGGILYTIDGNAPLSNEQLLKIASGL